MEESFHFTAAGLVSLFVLIVFILKARGNIFVLLGAPLFYILITFYNFFGSYNTVEFTLKDNTILLVSFSTFLFCYGVGKRHSINRLSDKLLAFSQRRNTSGENLATKKAVWGFFFLCVFYVIIDLVVNSLIYGSFERALLRFYSMDLEDFSYATYRNYLSVLFQLMGALVFVFRFFDTIYYRKSRLLLICVVLLMLVAIPRGSRGAVMWPGLMLVFADIFAKRFYNISIKSSLKQYAILGSGIVISFFFLTAIRSIQFGSFDDLVEVSKFFSIKDAAEGYAEREGELMIHDTKVVFDRFGNDVEFLPITYTASSILISWIPRSFYPEKPVSFGLMIHALKENSDIPKIATRPYELYYPGSIDWASGLAGEGWANGSWAGVILYAAVMGLFAGICSKLFFLLIVSSNYLNVIFAMQFFNMSWCFIRRSLQSQITPAIYMFLFSLVIVKILFRK